MVRGISRSITTKEARTQRIRDYRRPPELNSYGGGVKKDLQGNVVRYLFRDDLDVYMAPPRRDLEQHSERIWEKNRKEGRTSHFESKKEKKHRTG